MDKTNTTTNTNESQSKPLDPFISDSKTSFNSSMDHAGSSLDLAKDAAISTLSDAKSKWNELEHAVVARGQEAGKASRIYIYQHPFRSVLAASAAGLVMGFVLSMFRK
jgi:ElaB/YqjD/DUF883 family membrane-anchored ribosome-binding protein